MMTEAIYLPVLQPKSLYVPPGEGLRDLVSVDVRRAVTVAVSKNECREAQKPLMREIG